MYTFLKECASVRTCFTIFAVHAQCTVQSVRVFLLLNIQQSVPVSHLVLSHVSQCFAVCNVLTAVCKGPTLTVLQSAFVSH